MKKQKVFGKAAMAISAVLVIGAGGAAFAAVNETMLANEIGRTVEVAANDTLPPAITVALSGTTANAPDFTSADYTVSEIYLSRNSSQSEFPEAAMTAQDAADAAAEYLWRVFDYSPKGKTFEMVLTMNAHNFSASGKPYDSVSDMYAQIERAVWNGYLLDGTGRNLFIFSIDAIEGEMISVHREDMTPPEEPVEHRPYHLPESVQYWNGHREEYLTLAKGFAEKHLQTEIASAKFESTTSRGIVQDEDGQWQTAVNGAGEEVLLVEHNLYEISVTDEHGKEIIVSVTDNTKQLFEIYNADVMNQEDREDNAAIREEMGYK